MLQALSPRSIPLNQAGQQSYLKCSQGFLRSQLNRSQVGPKQPLDLASTPNLSQLISHAATQRNYQRRFDPPDVLAYYSSYRSAEPGQSAQQQMALRTAGDEDDVEVEEFEDFGLSVKVASEEEPVVRNTHCRSRQETAFSPRTGLVAAGGRAELAPDHVDPRAVEAEQRACPTLKEFDSHSHSADEQNRDSYASDHDGALLLDGATMHDG